MAGFGGDRLEVEHQPLDSRYRPREMLAARTDSGTVIHPGLQQHLEHIDATLRTRCYVECGHPSWSAAPVLAEHFAGRVRSIHLMRHPVWTCCSWLTQRAFQPALAVHLT